MGRKKQQQPETATRVQFSDIHPKVDLLEKIDHFELFVELPGFSKNDITIDMPSHQCMVLEGSITLRFEEEIKETGKERFCRIPKYIINERLSGAFTRKIMFPIDVDVGKIEASFENGILHVKLPIMTSSRKSKISII